MASTITPEQLKMLSNIFRIIAKEITTNEDKENLAPGEIGINYTEGSFYIRDPHTGNLFSPNSVENIKQISEKWDSSTGKLNADSVGYIQFYSSINQLSQLGISLSMDSIIRQMESPSILMSKIEYTNYASLGFPSDSGTVIVYKVNEEFVISSYYDNKTYATYDGRYNKFKHLFEGWAISDTVENTYVETAGDSNLVTITTEELPKDLDVITARLTHDIYPNASLAVNGGEYRPLVSINNEPISSIITSNNIIMLINNEHEKNWIVTYPNDSSVVSIVKLISNRVKMIEEKLNSTIELYNEKFEQLTAAIDNVRTSPGKIITYDSVYTATTNDINTITNIEHFDASIDRIIVNYNQTVLREGIDYTITSTNGIQLINNIKISTSDTLQFIVIKQ